MRLRGLLAISLVTVVVGTACGSPASGSNATDAPTLITGDGVEVTLPHSWAGAANLSELPTPTSTWTFDNLSSYKNDYTVLYAYSGERVLAITRVDTGGSVSSLREAGDAWAGTFEENNFAPISRDPATVDGHEAIRFVSTNPGSGTALAVTSDEYVFLVDSAIWAVAWSAQPDAFDEAMPGFDEATESVHLIP